MPVMVDYEVRGLIEAAPTVERLGTILKCSGEEEEASLMFGVRESGKGQRPRRPNDVNTRLITLVDKLGLPGARTLKLADLPDDPPPVNPVPTED